MTATSTALIELPQASDEDVRALVTEELDRILQHALFKDTTRMKRFLKYVVGEALEGRDDRLKGYSIGLEVFDRPDDFDPQADTIVRVQAGQLRRRLDLYYSGDGISDPVRILIPKGRYAPVFEMRREAEPDKAQKMATVSSIESQNRPGIAVLTFQNLTKDKGNGKNYFAEGVTAEIINALVQFRYLRIVARTASVMSSGISAELSEIGKQYDVQFVLSGNIRRVDNVIRISVNLLSTETGEHVYSKIFDRQCTPKKLFEIQEEIASYIAASIAAPFGAVNRFNRRLHTGRNTSMAGYESFLKYYEMRLSPSPDRARELLQEFEQVTEKTPRFSSAWAVRSLLNTFLAAQCVPSDDGPARLEAAIHAGTRASAIDPENSLAFEALFQAYFHSGKIEMAEKMAEKAMILNPNNYNILAYYAVAQAALGNAARAISFQSAAMDLIGRPPVWFYISTIMVAFQNKEYEKVTELVETVDLESPAAIQFMALACLGHLGRKDESDALRRKLLARDPYYGKHAQETLKYWQLNPDLHAQTLKGWRKAGLEI